jgi:hypothetical protein
MTELVRSALNRGDGKPAELAAPAGWVETARPITAATSASEELS